MKINREELLKELESITPGLSAKEIIEQSSCFIFKDKKVMTYNDEIACSHSSCLSIEGAVQAIPLLAILRKLGEDTVDVTTTKEELLIEGKKRKAGIRMEAEILLPVETIEQPKEWKVIPDDFAEAVHIIQECAGKDETQFNMTCIHIHPKWVEACDSFQAARYRIDTNISESTLIRRESLKHIITLGMTEFSETKTWIHFRNSTGLILSCRRYIEEYPDISKLFKQKGEKAFLPKGLKEAAERASIFSAENIEDNQVTIELKENKLKITGRGTSGWYKEIKKIKYSGATLSFTISPILLMELVQKYNDCEISSTILKIDGKKFRYITALGTVEEKEK